MDATLARIQLIALTPCGEGLKCAIQKSADPEAAWPRLERWLSACANPASLFAALQANPVLMESFAALMGASGYCADILAQNPEMASVLLDPDLATKPPQVERILKDGALLLQNAHSIEHRMDRLRLIKQEWSLRIAFNEICNLWEEPQVWSALSDVADAILQLSLQALWPAFSAERDGPADCPIQVVGFGKLGGRELNYSSDIDLLYLIPDDASEELEKLATRFANHLGRSLDAQMGRGMLFRVDLRLRPFGSRGPLVSKFSAVEAYYERYAEAWERLALIRSRVIVGDSERWSRMRDRTCFGRHVTDFEVLELAKQRERLEGLSKGDDLKRGPGGIRDVEFFTQIHQLVFGPDHAELRGQSTLEALDRLAERSLIEIGASEALQEGYVLLRRLEHLIQIEQNTQSHTMPESERSLRRLALCAGFSQEAVMLSKLRLVREVVRRHYAALVDGVGKSSSDAKVYERAGAQAPELKSWLDKIEGGEYYLDALAESDSGVERCVRLVSEGERVAAEVAGSNTLVEMVISGEILEPSGFPDELTGASVRRAWLREQASWVLAPDELLGNVLADVADWTVDRLAEDLPLSVFALGSYAIREMAPCSDLDLMLIAAPGCPFDEGESAGREFLSRVEKLKLEGSPLSVDLRLRPEGAQGAVVRTMESLRAYSMNLMEPWERLALSRLKLVRGDMDQFESIKEEAYGASLNRPMLDGLLALKKRVETERVDLHHRNRDFKLGPGGLDDLYWLCGLTALANPQSRPDHPDQNTVSRIDKLFTSEEINVFERDALVQAALHLIVLRWRLDVMGFSTSLVPENPDRLQSIAEAMGYEGANFLLSAHAEHRSAVRGIYLAQVERLLERIS